MKINVTWRGREVQVEMVLADWPNAAPSAAVGRFGRVELAMLFRHPDGTGYWSASIHCPGYVRGHGAFDCVGSSAQEALSELERRLAEIEAWAREGLGPEPEKHKRAWSLTEAAVVARGMRVTARLGILVLERPEIASDAPIVTRWVDAPLGLHRIAVIAPDAVEICAAFGRTFADMDLDTLPLVTSADAQVEPDGLAVLGRRVAWPCGCIAARTAPAIPPA